MKYLGALSGFIFGLLGFLLASFGLISVSMEVLLPLYFPISLAMRGMNFPGMLVIGIFFNAALFATIGYVLQTMLRRYKRNEKIVVYFFIGLVLFGIAAIVIEAATSGLSA